MAVTLAVGDAWPRRVGAAPWHDDVRVEIPLDFPSDLFPACAAAQARGARFVLVRGSECDILACYCDDQTILARPDVLDEIRSPECAQLCEDASDSDEHRGLAFHLFWTDVFELSLPTPSSAGRTEEAGSGYCHKIVPFPEAFKRLDLTTAACKRFAHRIFLHLEAYDKCFGKHILRFTSPECPLEPDMFRNLDQRAREAWVQYLEYSPDFKPAGDRKFCPVHPSNRNIVLLAKKKHAQLLTKVQGLVKLMLLRQLPGSDMPMCAEEEVLFAHRICPEWLSCESDAEDCPEHFASSTEVLASIAKLPAADREHKRFLEATEIGEIDCSLQPLSTLLPRLEAIDIAFAASTLSSVQLQELLAIPTLQTIAVTFVPEVCFCCCCFLGLLTAAMRCVPVD